MLKSNFDYNNAVIEQTKAIVVDAIFLDENGEKRSGSIRYNIEDNKDATVEMQA